MIKCDGHNSYRYSTQRATHRAISTQSSSPFSQLVPLLVSPMADLFLRSLLRGLRGVAWCGGPVLEWRQNKGTKRVVYLPGPYKNPVKNNLSTKAFPGDNETQLSKSPETAAP